MTKASPVFLRLRTIAFGCITFIAFLWTIVLCVIIFAQWANMSRLERSLVTVFLLINVITLTTLIILLLLEFRPWLDAARFLLLLILQFGIASAFVYWNAKLTCIRESPDQEGICGLITLLLTLGSWLIPVMATVYIGGLLLMLHRRRALAGEVGINQVERNGLNPRALSVLPITTPVTIYNSPVSIGSPKRMASVYRNSCSFGPSAPYRNFLDDFEISTKRNRLSKPIPYAL